MPTLTTLSCQLWSTVVPMLEAQLFQYRICIDLTILTILTMYTALTKFTLKVFFPVLSMCIIYVSFSVSLHMGLLGVFSVLFGVFFGPFRCFFGLFQCLFGPFQCLYGLFRCLRFFSVPFGVYSYRRLLYRCLAMLRRQSL